METCWEEMKERKADKVVCLVRCIDQRIGGVPSLLVDYQGKKVVGGWLAAMPSSDMYTMLIPVDFQDGLWIRMDLPLL